MTDMHGLVLRVFGDIFWDSKSKVGKPEYKDNFTLIGASYCGDVDVIAGLLKKGVDVNFVDDYGRTALYFACSRGQTQVVKQLLDAGADRNIKDKKKRSVLDIAQKYGYQDIVLLLKTGELQASPVKVVCQNQEIKDFCVYFRE